jgi:polyphosphate glucokinase
LTQGPFRAFRHELARDWEYDAISIGYPGLAGKDGPSSEPGNLGRGWVGLDFLRRSPGPSA